MKPVLKIGGVDFTEHVAEIAASNEDVDADGSGRDVYTGVMYRSKIADKDKLEVTMMRVFESTASSLGTALDAQYVTVTYLDPESNKQVTNEMYKSSITWGTQTYDRSRGQTRYDGITFSLIER